VAGTSDARPSPTSDAAAPDGTVAPFDRPYPGRDGFVDAHPGRQGPGRQGPGRQGPGRQGPGRQARLPARGAAGWANDLALTAWAYEPLWRHRSLAILTLGATTTAFELRTLRAWLAATLGPQEVAATAPLAGRRVLDVGCSAGLYARTLAADGADAFALDASAAFLRVGRRRADRDGLAITWVRGDAHALPFVDDAFDAAVVGATLNELGDPARAFRELARVVRGSGLVWTMYARRAAGPGRALQWLLERSGLRFPAPEAVDAWASAAGLAPLRRSEHGPVAFALYRKGAGAPPLAVSSPSPGWDAGPGSAGPTGAGRHSSTT
jgi:ubiquinone/menaquinone biosynthesis C-methylase UbiE